jgi:hypothetical protein
VFSKLIAAGAVKGGLIAHAHEFSKTMLKPADAQAVISSRPSIRWALGNLSRLAMLQSGSLRLLNDLARLLARVESMLDGDLILPAAAH